ncbi:Hsp20/alpha crystallin family protein [archaeon]|nr:MAG: Hsp20/alpha crystallin family protein [archaeon]
MTLRPYWNSVSDITPFQDNLGSGRIFADTNRELAKLRQQSLQQLAPLMSADLIESENDFHVHVDIPGAENLEISVDNGILTISAERKVKHEIDNDIEHTIERSFGKVKRRLALPPNAIGDNAKATYKDGVLTVTMPKSVESRKRKKLTIS